jgi:chromosome segregation ATPase
MEFEQIIKRLDWLDEEHRKDKTALSGLEERLGALEGDIKAINKKIKQLNGETSRLSVTAARMEQFDGALAQQRTEITKVIDGLEKRQAKILLESEKRQQIQIDGINKSINELLKAKETITEIKREMKARSEEETRRRKIMTEWETKMQELVNVNEDEQRTRRLSEESRRQDSKRLADLQGEVSAARKRLDEMREKNDLFSDGIRRLELRLNEIVTSESERRSSQSDFFETQARLQLERDRVWKDWEERFETLRKQTENMDGQIAQWDTAQRAVKRAQDTYEEITQKFDRRINEITEMQRLAEDRFRQEWVTFKADDQKRWTVHSLSQDEVNKDARGNIEKMQNRLTAVEDLAQMQQDVLQQTKEANEQLFQGMLAQIHELLSAYERIMGTTK